ncbi:MAG: TolC family protein [Deltaproteobacteria bacterium]|nr:TolC family protein [Deltaproteobacteria bacterium]
MRIALFFSLVVLSCAVIKPKQSVNLNEDFVYTLNRTFKSEELEKLLRETENSYILQTLFYNLKALNEELNRTVLNFFPNGSLDTKILDDKTNKNFISNFNLSWQLDFFGQLRKIYESHVNLYQAFQENLTWQDRLLKSSIALNYLSVCYIKSYLNKIYEGCKRLQSILNLVEERFNLGLETKDQVLAAKLDHLNCLDQHLQFTITVLESERNLYKIVGYNNLKFDLLQPSNPDLNLELDLIDSVIKRPDVKEAWQNLQQRIKLTEFALTDLLPSIRVDSQFIKYSGSIGGFFPLEASGLPQFILTQPVLSIPNKIFSYRKNAFLVESQFAQLSQVIREAIWDIVWSVKTYQLAQARKQLLNEGSLDFEKILDISKLRYIEGLTSIQELLLQEKRYIDYQANKVLADLAFAVSVVNLALHIQDIAIELPSQTP